MLSPAPALTRSRCPHPSLVIRHSGLLCSCSPLLGPLLLPCPLSLAFFTDSSVSSLPVSCPTAALPVLMSSSSSSSLSPSPSPPQSPAPFIAAGSLVLVTGINGFLGSHVAYRLLEAGYRVRGTARSQAKAEAVRALLPARFASSLSFVYIEELSASDAYQTSGALDGVAAITHTASPLPGHAIKDTARDMLTPAIEGTLNLLRAAAAHPGIRRVVVTSSIVAAMSFAPTGPTPALLTEEQWNPATLEAAAAAAPSSFFAYAASKALAEKAAWSFVDTNTPQFDLVTLCPPYFFGPTLSRPSSEAELPWSLAIFDAICNGKDRHKEGSGSFIDVRDLAQYHVEALINESAGGERFLISAGGFVNSEIAALSTDPQSASTSRPGNIDTAKVNQRFALRPRTKQATFADTAHFLTSPLSKARQARMRLDSAGGEWALAEREDEEGRARKKRRHRSAVTAHLSRQSTQRAVEDSESVRVTVCDSDSDDAAAAA